MGALSIKLCWLLFHFSFEPQREYFQKLLIYWIENTLDLNMAIELFECRVIPIILYGYDVRGYWNAHYNAPRYYVRQRPCYKVCFRKQIDIVSKTTNFWFAMTEFAMLTLFTIYGFTYL